MPTKYVDVRGQAIYCHYAGATTLPDTIPDLSGGRVLFFIHAAGSNGHAWHYQVEHLGARHSPVAPDLPGHGRSSGVQGLESVQEYADFAVTVLEALGLRSAVMVGRSMGGAIAMDLAVRYPERVSALVLIATAAKFTFAPERVEGLRAVAMGRAPQAFTTDGFSPATVKERFEVVREAWAEQVKTDPRVRYGDVLACSRVDLREAVRGIRQPTLILAGRDDTITPPSEAELLARLIAGARLQVIEQASHNLPTERPAEVNGEIERLLDELE